LDRGEAHNTVLCASAYIDYLYGAAYKSSEKEHLMQQSARTAKQLGAIIRRERRNMGLSQTALGEKIGLRQATLSRLERGENETKLSTLLDALTALGLELTIDKRGRRAREKLEDLF
jgi:HTH-type transcriptional regulator / antitoxin HipB